MKRSGRYVLRSNQTIEAAKAGLSRIDYDQFRGRLLTMLDMVLTLATGLYGIGLDIHEIPYFGKSERADWAKAWSTDGPGIYLDGKYGVRIKDDLLTKQAVKS